MASPAQSKVQRGCWGSGAAKGAGPLPLALRGDAGVGVWGAEPWANMEEDHPWTELPQVGGGWGELPPCVPLCPAAPLPPNNSFFSVLRAGFLSLAVVLVRCRRAVYRGSGVHVTGEKIRKGKICDDDDDKKCI